MTPALANLEDDLTPAERVLIEVLAAAIVRSIRAEEDAQQQNDPPGPAKSKRVGIAPRAGVEPAKNDKSDLTRPAF